MTTTEAATKGRRIKWYRSPVGRDNLRALNQRSDLWGALQTLGFLGVLATTGTAAGLLWAWLPWHGAAAVIATFFHGTCYQFLINGFHELVHDSVFRTRRLNRFFLRIFSFLGWYNHHHFWASHTEHHKYTLHPPDDLEVVLPMPLTLKGFLEAAVVNPRGLWFSLGATVRTALGRVEGDWNQHLFPPSKPQARRRLFNWARLLLAGHATLTAVSLYFGLWQIPLLVTLAPFYGGWLHYLCNNAQHAGLTDKVEDFRLCCRTHYLGPFVQFLYWHMNYHTEHHMYAGVPCYNLPKLHRIIKDDLPYCPNGLIDTWREIIGVLRKQREDPDYGLRKTLPEERAATATGHAA